MNYIFSYFREKGIRMASIRWILALIKPYLWKISGLILLRCGLVAVGVGSAVVNKYIVDMASRSMNLIWGIVLAVGCTVCSLIGNMLLSIYITQITERLSFHIRGSLYEHILNSTWNSRNQFHSEELLSRLTSDVQTIANGVVSVTTSLLASVVQLCLAFVLLWHYDPMLAGFALLTGPFAAVFSFIIGRKMKQIQIQLQQTEADYRVYLQEQISNADTIKVFQQEKNSFVKLDSLQQKRMYWVIRKNRMGVILRLGIGVVFSGSYLVAFVTGAVKIAAGMISYGTMTAFLSLVNQVQAPVYSMYQILTQVISVLASSTRTMEISAMTMEEVSEDTVDFHSAVGISLENVGFSYALEKPVLENISAKVEPGSTVVLAGPSGQGKTTLVRLLLGFLSPDSGQIRFFDQTGKSAVGSSSCRSLISYVPQGYTLFSGSIADNLRMGNPAASEEELRNVLEMACAWDFVQQLPEGMDTVIGEKAYGLSGGQAQRIAIARALLRDTPILIMDEATSSLDAETEHKILTNICQIEKVRTCIIISHNQAIRSFADQVVDLSNLFT